MCLLAHERARASVIRARVRILWALESFTGFHNISRIWTNYHL